MTKWSSCNFSKDLTGKTFCDIGCWEGLFCVEAKKRGAKRVVGVDMCVSPALKENKRKHNFEFVQMDVQSEKFLTLPVFDILSCTGLLYHIENPMSLIFRLRTKVKEKLILETLIIRKPEDTPVMRFYPEKAGTPSRWWAPNEKCLIDMLETAGFKDIKTIFKTGSEPEHQRMCVHAVPGSYVSLEKTAPRRSGKMEIKGGKRGGHM